MANEQISQFTDGGVPVDADVVGGYLGASPGVAGSNRRWSFSNIFTYLGTKLFATTNTWVRAQRGSFAALVDAATITIDMAVANNFNLVIGGARTLGVPSNMVAGQTGTISIRQDATGGRTLAFAWPFQFPGGVAPVISSLGLSFSQLYYSVNSYAQSVVTMTIAAPCVVSWTNHGLVSGQRVQFTTTGALPTGLAINTSYWVTKIDDNSFNLSTSMANAAAGVYITTTGSQSGVHTATNASITIAENLGIA